MTDQHPITPPPELRRLWAQQAQRMDPHDPVAWLEHVANQAARWGADQELEACCKLLELTDSNVREFLHSARRPKPPILAEEALVACERSAFGIPGDRDTIRRALERLKELEGTNG